MEQENIEKEIEKALRLFNNNAALNNEFYKRLLFDEMILLVGNLELTHGYKILHKGQQIKVCSYENGVIPLFTSIDKIFENASIKGKVKTLTLKGRDIFDLTKGASYILNPYSFYSKELTIQNVQEILSGEHLKVKEILFAKETMIQIGQPAIYPTVLIDEIKNIFTRNLDVSAAYLGWIFNPSTNEPAHFIFGLDIKKDLNTVIKDISLKINQFRKPDEIIDFIKIESNDFISDYFVMNIKPFYQMA